MDYWLRQTVDLCLETEKVTRKLYRSFARKSKRIEEQGFWKRVAEDESCHIAHWNKLIRKSEKAFISNPFSNTRKTIRRLAKNLEAIAEIEKDFRGRYDTEEALRASILVETFMMNPAFTILFQLAGNNEDLKYPREEYEKHVLRFTKYAEKLSDDSELRLGSLALLNTFYQSEEIAEKLTGIETLRGLIPICSWCKKVRQDVGDWTQIERYVQEHSFAKFSHGICPDCKDKI